MSTSVLESEGNYAFGRSRSGRHICRGISAAIDPKILIS